MEIKKFVFTENGDERGNLVALEEHKNIPFDIKRVYYIYDTLSDVTRGFHAHKKLEQILICVNGSCKIKLDNGKEVEIVTLNKKNEGLYISNNIWREMYDFEPNTVLLVLASEYYNEEDYIRNYNDFLDYVKK